MVHASIIDKLRRSVHWRQADPAYDSEREIATRASEGNLFGRRGSYSCFGLR